MGQEVFQSFNDPNLVQVNGNMSISKAVKTGEVGSLTVAGSIVAAGGLSVTGSFVGASLTAVSQLTAATGISITAGGETITAGGLSITAGGLSVTGGEIVDVIKGGNSAVVTIASSGAIPITSRIVPLTVTAGAAVTALSLTAGSAGQEITIINENAVGGSTMIISSGVIVTSGTTTSTISGLAAKHYVWDAVQSLWVAFGNTI
jgi:hypothetical protein